MFSKEKIVELAGEEKIIKYSQELCKKKFLDQETKYILEKLGVPQSASPYITFLEEDSGAMSKLNSYYDLSIYEQLGNMNISKERFNEVIVCFQKYIVLGNLENGVFVLNEKYQVIQIDNETLEEYYINQTLDAFLESLLVYKRIIYEVQGRYTEIVFFDEYITEKDIEKLKIRLLNIDEHSLDDNSFWFSEIESLEERF